ncbi:MAG TPA: DUF488 domain-containing protein [Candidatus Nitrosotenuis sp.]|nr:DUF488 domain-containing protein [Candidatus Nitrosotenuis sp.]
MRKNIPTIFAVGHSTREIKSFLELLKAHSIDLLVDIRTIPRSRHNPQFNEENLKKALKDNTIDYIHLTGLGGLRHPHKDSINYGWRNASFRGFADYMQTEEFESSLEELIDLGKKHVVAIMCAEGNPFRCHRSLVADALLARHIKTLHISSVKSSREHALTPFAKVENHKITYPSKV